MHDCLMHVWIHSNADTGKPDSIDVFEINGAIHMTWFREAMQPDDADAMAELADYFFRYLGKLDASAWFAIKCQTEDAMGIDEHYAEIVKASESQLSGEGGQ